jgi:NTE family protein
MARGTAHIGVLRELEKNHIPINLIAGTSVGSLIGGGFAAGLTVDELETLALKIRWSTLGRLSVSRLGFNSNARTEEYVRAVFPVHEFDKLRIPIGVVATDLQEGKLVVFTEGDLALAIRASCAVPIFYTPVLVNGRMMVDGGIVGHLPASTARLMGADVVIAVDVNSQGTPIPPPTNIFAVMSQSLSIMGRSTVQYLYQDADVVIRPQIGHIRPDDLSKAAEMIAAGEEATRRNLKAIRRQMERPPEGLFRRLFARRDADPRRVSSWR